MPRKIGRLISKMFVVQDDTRPTETEPSEPPTPAKITARMLRIRELIDQGEYPDRDVLAERIVTAAMR